MKPDRSTRPEKAASSALLGAPPRGFWQGAIDALANLGVGVKIKLLLLGLGLLPPLTALLFLRQASTGCFQNTLALYIAIFLVILYPLAKAMEELLVVRQVRRINTYVEEVKAGRATPHIELPEEQGDEHGFLRLQRNIFWMVQGLKSREARLEEALRKLEQARRRILESIEYASLIQRSFLPSRTDLGSALGDHFLLWLPRDGVGGDAYWVKRLEHHTVLAVFDCTGHGVPGAFLTLIVNSLFEQNYDETCRNNPARLLSKMNRAIKHSLSQHGRRDLSDDGLEGSVCCIDHQTRQLYFAGARSFMFLATPNGLLEIKGDRHGVGFVNEPYDREFANHRIELQETAAVFLFTDGITDQVGGPKRLPLGRGRMRQWLEKNQHLPMADQHRALEQAFAEYMGRIDQRDDVTVLGFATRGFLC